MFANKNALITRRTNRVSLVYKVAEHRFYNIPYALYSVYFKTEYVMAILPTHTLHSALRFTYIHLRMY